jgi:amino acid adenylation domain-containing protein
VRTRLQDYLTRQVERNPDAVALVFQGQRMTYGELDRASNRLARALRACGCAQGDRIALMTRKSPRAIVGIFGVLKADCIYVPIDTASPPARIERSLNVCDSQCVLAERSSAELLSSLISLREPGRSLMTLWMDDGPDAVTAPSLRWRDIESLPDGHVDSSAGSSDVAHILFTSGSTGLPKGVAITHSNVIHFIRWAVTYFGISSTDRISGHPPLHFDLSTFDLYGSIAAGAQLHLLPPELSLIPHRLADYIRDAELTQWFSVPSALAPLAKSDVLAQNDFPALQRLLWCGEKFPVPALMYFMQRLPHSAFVNLYGPTEATIASSYYRVPRCPEDPQAEIPIGQACDGESLLVLDDNLQPSAPNEIGSLYIGGVGLSPGYWKNPTKTAEVFLEHPSQQQGNRIYKTGDLAKLGADGLIYLIGRSDTQIKSRGCRIELGEIEAALQVIPGIDESAVVAIESADTFDRVICCAYTMVPGHRLSPMDLKSRLTQSLPPYMIPQRWMPLERMPHNANGKTDRPALRELFGGHEAPTAVAAT